MSCQRMDSILRHSEAIKGLLVGLGRLCLMILFVRRKIALIAIQTRWRLCRLEIPGSLLQMSREGKMRSRDEDEAEGWQRRVLLTNSCSSCVCLLRREKNLLRAERPPSLGCVSSKKQLSFLGWV